MGRQQPTAGTGWPEQAPSCKAAELELGQPTLLLAVKWWNAQSYPIQPLELSQGFLFATLLNGISSAWDMVSAPAMFLLYSAIKCKGVPTERRHRTVDQEGAGGELKYSLSVLYLWP